MTPAWLRDQADLLCTQLNTLADAWERDLADVDRFRALARSYMDEAARLRDLIALHGPVGAGNEADTLVEMKRLAFLAGIEAAAALCESRAGGGGRYKTVEETALLDAADAIRDIESKP